MKKALRFALLACTLLFASAAFAQAPYPQKPIRIVVSASPGGGNDLAARIIGQKLSEKFKQSVIVDNKPGANNIIAASYVAKAAPDGYTLLLTNDNTLVMNQFLYSKLPYEPLQEFEPVILVGRVPLIIATSITGLSSFEGIVKEAKDHPGKMSYGFGALSPQLAGELIKRSLNLDMQGIAYKGSAPTVQGLLSGDVTFIIDGLTAAQPLIESGKFRGIARLGLQKIPSLPNLPPLADQAGLKGFDVSLWMGIVTPKGTPPAVVHVLESEITEILRMKDVQEKLIGAGILPDPVGATAFRQFIGVEEAKWKDVIKAADIKLD